MSAAESLYNALSVAALLLEHAAADVVRDSAEPVQPTSARLGKLVAEIHDLQHVISTQHQLAGRQPLHELVLSAADRRFAKALVDAQQLEQGGRIAEAIEVLQQLLREEPTLERSAVAARQIERLLEVVPDDGAPDLLASEGCLAEIGALAPSELEDIDRELQAAASKRFQKVAFLVATVMIKMSDRLPAIPDVFYAQRVLRLVKLGELEAQGALQRMRYSEVRLPRS